MWSSDRRGTLAALAGALALSACGFAPIYGSGGPGQTLRGRVAVDAPTSRVSFELVARLEDRLGRADRAIYRLTHNIGLERQGIAVTGANNISRVRITGRADYTLREVASGVQVLAGTVTTFTAYSTTGSTLATDTAERDAEDRLMVILADRMVDELLSGAARLT
ncbi:MAG: LPS assembly lipoprotein LptE [Pseudomonadota bacterium]